MWSKRLEFCYAPALLRASRIYVHQSVCHLKALKCICTINGFRMARSKITCSAFVLRLQRPTVPHRQPGLSPARREFQTLMTMR